VILNRRRKGRQKWRLGQFNLGVKLPRTRLFGKLADADAIVVRRGVYLTCHDARYGGSFGIQRDRRLNMKIIQRPWSDLLCCFPIISCLTFVACLGQTPKPSVVLNSPVDRTTAVSFFYIGDLESHFRQPTNLYVAAEGDPRLHTVHFDSGPNSRGLETWITASEMRALVDKLAHSDLAWVDSKTVEPIKGWHDRRDGQYSFDLTVVSSNGTATAKIRLTRMCDELLQFDSVMPTPRLRWQFQILRWDDGCVVPGYHNETIPKN